MEIDHSKLKCDYKNNPLKRGEQPDKDDVKYLFLTLNLGVEECAEICGCTVRKIRLVCIEQGYKKTEEQRTECRNRTVLKKYGCANVSQLENIKEVKKEKSIEKYGVDNVAKAKEVKEKTERTNLEKFGGNPMYNTECIEKYNNTIRKKYGVENIFQNKHVQERQRNTMLEKYGKNNPQKCPEIRNKSLNTRIQKYGDTKLFGTHSFKQQVKQTNLDKYGVENIMQTPEMRQHFKDIGPQITQKCYETKKKNNSFHISKPEQEIYEKLCEKFKSVKRQYKCVRYPFCCDFYIEDIDLFIEFQGTWTHGGEPFNKDTCKQQLLEWQEKAKFSEFYEAAIETWTIRDVEKRRWANEYNLKWIEFFSIEEFNTWYDGN